MIRISLFLIICLIFSANVSAQKQIPQTLFWDSGTLQKEKSKLNDLISKADKLVKADKVYSVMNKEQVPPSGDKHDYMSQAPYWWADPTKPNGLPYIRRDGERNPELNKISDTNEMDSLIEDAETTTLAYYFSGDEKYAGHSAKLIRTWFIDEKTRQNPNLNFGQGIPGINTGRGIGLIETRELYRIIDAAILLQNSKSWTNADHQALKKWFGDYLKWMLESDIGKDESDEKNNHGTYYDVQIISYAIFADKPDIARKQIEITKQRIKDQFEKDGSQPLELARTLSWNYTNMNLFGFFTLARLAENLKIDLWNFETEDGKSIKKGFDWLIPFVKNEKNWTYQQIKPRSFNLTVQLLRLAAQKYKNPELSGLADKLEEKGLQTSH
ncbi:MAG: alginate lyase family protein [Pyrinomonadaceae bacterium]|nr:alginate lyase family protein [Pyrinomonadaceae bacterium]